MIGIQDTSNRALRDILSNGVELIVPRFQRDYAWEREQWEDLWEDMLEVGGSEVETYHYMGYVVLQRQADRLFSVIDGQQRLVTLSLVILAAMQAIAQSTEAAPERELRVASLRSAYIGSQNPVTLTTVNKLRLNRNNERLYAHYLSAMLAPPKTGLSESERALVDAYRYFQKQLGQIGSDGRAIATFVERIASRLFFTVISVSDELNAYRVFETLNARGVQLSSVDLVKNYLFSLVDRAGLHVTELEQLEDRWSRILSQLGPGRVQPFLRAYWGSRYPKVRDPQLFRAIRTEIVDSQSAFAFVRALDQAAVPYTAFADPGHELWQIEPELADAMRTLRLFGVRQQYTLLLAGYEILKTPRFKRLVQDVIVVSLRYNLLGSKSSGDQETVYNEVARQIRQQNTYDPKWLARVYPRGEEFLSLARNWVAPATSKGDQLAKFLLARIEDTTQQRSAQPLARGTTLEHVMPQHLSEVWPGIPETIHRRTVQRLGNLALLEAGLNREAGDAAFADKLDAYRRSQFRTTNELTKYGAPAGAWDEDSVVDRQRDQAVLVASIFRIQELDA